VAVNEGRKLRCSGWFKKRAPLEEYASIIDFEAPGDSELFLAVMVPAVLTAMGANAASDGKLFRILSYTGYEQDGQSIAKMAIELNDEVLAGSGTGQTGSQME